MVLMPIMIMSTIINIIMKTWDIKRNVKVGMVFSPCSQEAKNYYCFIIFILIIIQSLW